MKEKLIKIINSYFPTSIVGENIEKDKWQEILETTEYNKSIFYLFNSIKYYTAYYLENNAVNLSINFIENDQSIGILPLMLHKNKSNQWVLSTNGEEIVEPIFKQNLSKKIRKRLENKILKLLIDLCKLLNIKQSNFVNSNFHKLSEWYIRLLEIAEYEFTTYHFLVNLSLDIQQIRSKFRDRYKTLVNKGLKEWNIQVYEKVSNEFFDKFRLFHKTIAGKTTRPIESWNIQKEKIKSNESLIITASNKKNKLVGAALFSFSNHIVSYSVGVYDRDLFKKPIAHGIMMKAIEVFKKKGLVWFEIGKKSLHLNRTKPTQKDLSISHFKEGFATDVMPRQHLVINLCNL